MGGEFLKRPQVREEIVRVAEVAAEEHGYEIVEVEITKQQPAQRNLNLRKVYCLNDDQCSPCILPIV